MLPVLWCLRGWFGNWVPSYPSLVLPEPLVLAAAPSSSAVLCFSGLQRGSSELVWALGVAGHPFHKSRLSRVVS